MQTYFPEVENIEYQGTQSKEPFSFKHYNAKQKIFGKTMAEHLKFAACYWHNFCWNGSDMFGSNNFTRDWHKSDNPMTVAHDKANAAFEFFRKLNVEYYCFHDVDIAPEGNSAKEYQNNLEVMTDYLYEKQRIHGIKLLWGTANCFTNPRYAAGAATNPNPEIFAWSAMQVYSAMQATKKLGGSNYVLWGGREGYETLLNTDLQRERKQLGRFIQMVVEHKYRIGFKGEILIEPKPKEPTKHQYDYDVSTVFGFLKEFNLEKEVKVNLETNHATLSKHSMHHEVANAISLGILGSLDVNRGDPELGWDTDQFPNSVEENTLMMYEVIKSGGIKNGGLNFDAKLRRQSNDKYDLFHSHIGGMDTMALSLKVAVRMIESQEIEKSLKQRYQDWDKDFGQDILEGKKSLLEISDYVVKNNTHPISQSGEQEKLENIVNNHIYNH